jgi:hypothetical protein
MGDDDDIDDSMGANPEPVREDARADLGYQETLAPRSRKPRGDRAGRWVVEFREGAEEPAAPAATPTCRVCGPVPAGTILHSHGDDCRRNVCGPCQGKLNRQRMGGTGGSW